MIGSGGSCAVSPARAGSPCPPRQPPAGGLPSAPLCSRPQLGSSRGAGHWELLPCCSWKAGLGLSRCQPQLLAALGSSLSCALMAPLPTADMGVWLSPLPSLPKACLSAVRVWGGLDWTLGKAASLREWPGTGPGCPGRWWSPHPWRGSKTGRCGTSGRGLAGVVVLGWRLDSVTHPCD